MWKWTSSPRRRTWPGASENCAAGAAARDSRQRGIALPGVLLLAAFLVGVTGWLVGHVRTDLVLAAEQEEEAAVTRLASAAVQAVALALGQLPDWTAVDGLATGLPCPAASMAVTPVDEPKERAWHQAASDAASRWGSDAPQWRLLWTCHGPGVLGRWPALGSAPLVIVWVADEPEGDNAPLTSANQRLMLHALAVGRGGARGTAAATVVRQAPGAPVVLAAWRGAAGA